MSVYVVVRKSLEESQEISSVVKETVLFKTNKCFRRVKFVVYRELLGYLWLYTQF